MSYWHLGVDLGSGCKYLGIGPLVPRINLHSIRVDTGRILQAIQLDCSEIIVKYILLLINQRHLRIFLQLEVPDLFNIPDRYPCFILYRISILPPLHRIPDPILCKSEFSIYKNGNRVKCKVLLS
jgi:hypothetical protein